MTRPFAFISNLVGGKTYGIQVRAKNVYGYGPLSRPFTVKLPNCSSTCIDQVTSYEAGLENNVGVQLPKQTLFQLFCGL